MEHKAVPSRQSEAPVPPLPNKMVTEKDLRENFERYQRWIESLAADQVSPYPALPEEPPRQNLVKEPVWIVDVHCSS
jgi:hypothetical protein